MRNSMLLLVLASALATGCATRHGARPAALPLPEPLSAGATSDAAFERDWWRRFEDPVLNGLIDEALGANRDLHAAAARHAAARELAGAAALAHLPFGGPFAGASQQHASEHELPNAPDRTSSTITTGLAVGWEADLFGRLRGRQRAAAARAGIAASDVRGVQVALAAQVAEAYFDFRGAQRELEMLDQLHQRTSELVTLTGVVVRAGRGTRVDVLRAQQIADDLEIAISAARHAEQRAHHRLATLTGRTAGTLAIEPAPAATLRVTVLPIGTAADLLRRRPDIHAAELRIAAAAGAAATARAELFPRIDVSGGVSLIAGSLGTLTDAAAGSWFVAPRIVWNVLDWPRLRREARAANHLEDAAVAEFEQAVLRALEEVRSGVVAYEASMVQLQAAERRARAAEDAARIAAVQYREGLVDSLGRILAERDALAAGLSAVRTVTAQRHAVVDLYRVLGGGWR